ncbi:TetR/AcrR family transcriptional regulator [Saccharopolyspora erythraea]|uniref:TetR/AcrR family transcriptional regulator n=1 Tax=Saccharopolyspora erythraea TaxID=1836 RepID=UPI001BAC4A8A|nr:TetR family transcriptional regulator [Saccharopolyspora erythraea]QUH04003.1 TetR/AcrR family transcriptional regulator [Saccharopolyspora erythraea]
MTRTRRQRARREQFIDAALRAINERGRDNVRIRDIATEAGVSPGSVLYHYPELAELMFDVHRTVADRFYRHRADTVDAAGDAERKLAAAIETGLPSGRDDEVACVLYEMHGLADRSSAHAALMTSLYDREVALYGTVLEVGRAAGRFTLSRPVREIAATLVALEDGLGLHLMSNNTSIERSAAKHLLTEYAREATGCATTS